MSICATCGNKKTANHCERCLAEARRYSEPWRKTKDKLDKRPERNQERSFFDILDGKWESADGKVAFEIDTYEGTYQSFRNGQPKAMSQYKIISENQNSASFIKGNIEMSASITPNGLLHLIAAGKEMDFCYVWEEVYYRTCPDCFQKTDKAEKTCKSCNHRF